MALNKVTYVDGETIIGAANLNAIQDEIISQEANKVPTSRKINNNPLTSDITLSAANVGAVPTTRTVNNKALSSNITLAAADIEYESSNVGATLGSLNTEITSNASSITATQRAFAVIENSTTATRAYYVGDYVWVSDRLFRIKANISNGGTITDGTNAERILEAERSIIYVTNTGVTCAERTYVDLASVTLRAGTWLLLGNHEFGSSSEFAYQDVFRKGTSVHGITRNIPGGSGGGAVTMAVVTQDSGTGTFTYGTYGYGTAGTSRTANKIIVVAIRLY